jgi:hypothetical protein
MPFFRWHSGCPLVHRPIVVSSCRASQWVWLALWAFTNSYPLSTPGQSRAPSLRQGYVVLAILSTMRSSDSSTGLPFPLRCATVYRVGYVGRHPTTRRGLPSPLINCLSIPRPIHRRVLRRCTSKSFAPSMAFAPSRRARLPLGPLSWVHTDDAAGFTSCYGLLSCDDIASAFGSPLSRMVTTRSLGRYLDRTCTGKLIKVYLGTP